MILLEYIIAQHQNATLSVAINSKKSRQANPGAFVKRLGRKIIWELKGLQLGQIENIDGQPRATRIDFYIGMEDLIEQRRNFITSNGVPIGNIQGLRIPVGTERTGGKRIRWNGPVGRVEIEDVIAIIPPFRISKNDASSLILNIDRESSPYPITSDEGNQTMRELHFGIEHDYTVVHNGRVKICRISFEMTENEYATVLEFIDRAITYYNTI